MKTEETTDTEIVLTEDQENEQVLKIASASLTNIRQNRAKLEEIAATYKDKKIDGIDDKANYKTVSAGITATRTARTTVAKLTKNEKSYLKKAADLLDTEAELLIGIVAPIEAALKNEKERIDTLKQEAEDEKLRVLEEQKQARIATLFSLGMKFNGSYYEVGDLNITPIQVTQFSEAQFEGFVSQAKVVFEAEQLRIAEEEAAQERERAEQEAEQLRLRNEAIEKQKELDVINQERELMRHERTEHRVDTLKRHEFTGDLKVGAMTRANFILKAEFIVDATKAEWDAKMAEFSAYLIETAKPKEILALKPIAAVTPLNGHEYRSNEELNTILDEAFPAVADVLVAEEAVKQDLVINTTLSFTEDEPFLDVKVGKATMRIYPEPFLDAAQDGLTKEDVAASGTIGSELLFLVIKGK